MSTIRKALISAIGSDVSNVSVVEATISLPLGDEVQVRVIYAGFSGADVEMRLGRYPMQRKPPFTPGYCMVGRVEKLGPACAKQFKAGDAVAALTVYDAQAELINVPEKYLVSVPPELSATNDGLQQVAAFGLDWNTAYGIVEHAAKVQASQRVFVHGLSGACGYALMALCLLKGAKVYGTASERNHAQLGELGATPFVYTDKNWVKEMQKLGGAHAVFDPLGFESYDESYSILSKEGGILVAYALNKAALEGGKQPSVLPVLAKFLARKMKVWSGKRVSFFSISRDAKTFKPDFEALMRMAIEGKIRAPIKKVYELTEESIREAHGSWGKSPGMGSVLVRVSGTTP